MQPRVSVIIPAFNRRHSLPRALASVQAQRLGADQVLLVDDGSTDGTSDWVRTQHPEVELLNIPQNRGPAAARNLAILRARGELIAFLDSDDEWLPEYLEAQSRNLADRPSTVLSFCNYTRAEQDGRRFQVELEPRPLQTDAARHILMDNTIHSLSIVVARRETLLQAGLFREELRAGEDMDLYLRLIDRGEISHLPRTLVVKHQGRDNVSQDYRLGHAAMMRTIDLFFAREQSAPYRAQERSARCNWTLRMARTSWDARRDGAFALRMLATALFLSPSQFLRMCWKKLNTPPLQREGIPGRSSCG